MANSTSTQQSPAGWFISRNPVLDLNEHGIETDTGKFKIGNGTARWSALPYGSTVGAITVTGSKSGGAALVSLLAALVANGTIVDNTSA
jgi:hypothetical protein